MEPGQRKSIALTKFQQAGKATIDKIKKQKSESKVPKQQGFDVVQIGSLLFAAWIVLWIVAASVVSAVFFVRYIGIVEDNQAWYLQHGSARSAAAETTAVLQAAIEAKEALIASINYGLIKTSYDYAAIESTLAPTLLLQPFVRTFDITFSDRTAGLHIRHQPGEGGRQLILQSNAEDCYLLGTQGCADLGVQPQRFPAWHTDAMFLNMSFEGADQDIMTQQQMVQLSKQAGANQQWFTTPMLAPGARQNDSSVVWYPTVRLLFRQPLPEAWSATNEILCGQISVEVMALTGDLLRDGNLGENGRVYVVDSSGAVLSALDLQDTITMTRTGALQFRHITEMGSFGNLVASAFKGTMIEEMQVKEGSLAAVVQPLRSPLEMFAVVVVSRYENTDFQDQSIVESMSVLLTFASLPYIIVTVTLTIVFVSANSGMQLSKMSVARITGAATSLASRRRNRSVVMRSSSEGPLFDKAMEGMGNKVSQKSIVMGDDTMYDDDGRPLAVQHRRTHILNDVYFSSSKSKWACLVRCVRCFCCCCRGRQRD
ncbi:unnamed protein product [Symbiodinium microadriaticum]|nr:unnamed protein product [Symbiodinium microadriaticum]